MNSHHKPAVSDCPETSEISDLVWADAKKAFDDLVEFCRKSELPFGRFEAELLVRMAALGCCLVCLFLSVRYERLDVQPFLQDGKYRAGHPYAERTLKTFYGEVTYGRQYLQPRRGSGSGIFPLDIVLA